MSKAIDTTFIFTVNGSSIKLPLKQVRVLHRQLGDYLDKLDRQEQEERTKADLEKRQEIIEVGGRKIVCLKSTISDDYIAAWPAGFTRDNAPWLVAPANLHNKARKWAIWGPVYERWPGDTGGKRALDPARYVHLDSAVREAIALWAAPVK